jgi:hypothetical protein
MFDRLALAIVRASVMEEDLPIAPPLLDDLAHCDRKLVVALVPIRDDSGPECIAARLARLRLNPSKA